jgi:GTPase SAR1 family protein
MNETFGGVVIMADGGYKARKEEVLRIYEEYLPFKKRYGDTIAQNILESRVDNISKGKFCLIVAGEAKSGKSTFINAFLGADIMPTGVQQCTSSIIEINYGGEESLEAVYADGRKERKGCKDEIRKFLEDHAALKDEYRKIPVTAINNEILVKSRGNIKESAIKDLIEGVKNDNTYNLPQEEYEKLIRKYIGEKKREEWKDIVTEIKISYPFSKEMKDITIIDSPGINAAGMVGEITIGYIDKADAIIFVKSLTGQALESTAFRKFLDSNARNRSKGALLLVLTGKSQHSPEEAHTLQQQAVDMYSEVIRKECIITVDSKLQLFHDKCKGLTDEEIEYFLDKSAFDAAENRWYKKSKKIRSDFFNILTKDANFGLVNEVLEKFARKAQNQQLFEFLKLIGMGYTTIGKKLEDRRDMLEKSGDYPEKLQREIAKKQEELDAIAYKMNAGIDALRYKYLNDDTTRIKQKAEEEFAEYKKLISEVNTVDDLKKKASNGQEKFNVFRKRMQEQIIGDCNEQLVAITEITSISARSLIPVLADEDLKRIEEDAGKNAKDDKPIYEKKFCSSEYKIVGYESVYSQDKHVKAMREAIIRNLENTKSAMINSVQSDFQNITKEYKSKLQENANQVSSEYNDIYKRLKKAEDMKNEMDVVKGALEAITSNERRLNEIKSRIENVIS